MSSLFISSLLGELGEWFSKDDIQSVQNKCSVLINQHLRKGKGKQKKEKAAPSINAASKKSNLYDLYRDEDMDDVENNGDYDYRGKDEDLEFM